MKTKRFLALLIAMLLVVSGTVLVACNGIRYSHPESVSVYETTGTKASLLGRKSSLTFRKFGEEDYYRQTIYVNIDNTYQEYMGNGASMTHASAYLLMQADEETRKDILNDLFSKDGANFTIVRIPVGASDYVPGTEYFTCDDMPSGQTDMALEHFNLDHDQEIIAVLKEVLEINPNVKFMASPWSAPAWMKANNLLVGAGELKSDMLEVYADYLVKFVSEYKKEGINISMLTILNEPSVGALSYPTMDMSPADAADVTLLTGQKLKAAGLNVDIISWDFNYGYGSAADLYFQEIYESDAGKYSGMAGLHGYAGDYEDMKIGIELLSREYKKGSLITEITESSGSKDFAANLTYACRNIVVNPCAVQMNYDDELFGGCSGSLYWNLVLDSHGQPTPAFHGNDCYGVISLDQINRQGNISYKYTKSSAYYAMAHMSKFLYDVDGVPCKAIYAGTETATDLCIAAYYRNDGAIVIIVCNPDETNNAPIDIVIEGKVISYEMMPQSVVTFVC